MLLSVQYEMRSYEDMITNNDRYLPDGESDTSSDGDSEDENSLSPPEHHDGELIVNKSHYIPNAVGLNNIYRFVL